MICAGYFRRKCAYCGVIYGVEMGTQPKGSMSVRFERNEDVASSKYGTENKGKGSIQITHRFPAGIQGPKHPNPGKAYDSRTEYIYLPGGEEGMECLGLIREGWKRKLLYTIGHSVTLNASDRIIFGGIHFKTSRTGGVENYGWPDKTYFARVKDEFKAKGITVDDIPKRYKRKIHRQ